MRDINILDKQKQLELNNILTIVLGYKQIVKPELIIVFGNYLDSSIKTNIISEGNINVEYKSVIKLLLITRKTSQEKNYSISRKILSDLKSCGYLNYEFDIIIEDISSFKKYLREKRYFYLDIIREGVLLYDSLKYDIEIGEKISEKEIRGLKESDFNFFYNHAKEFFIDSNNAFSRGNYNMSIFYLHQSIEFFITSYLLVKNGYKPKTHDLDVLYSKIKQETNLLNNWFNLDYEDYYFEQLRSSYINVRYDKNFKLEKEDILYYINKVLELSQVVKILCLKELKK